MLVLGARMLWEERRQVRYVMEEQNLAMAAADMERMLLTSMRKRALVSQGVGFKKKQKDAGESS
jgi:hypothetical protein